MARNGAYTPNTTRQQFIQAFLSLLALSSAPLDAACGAGRRLPFLIEKGHTVLGIDLSQGMLTRAQAYFSDVPFEKVGLQEMAYQAFRRSALHGRNGEGGWFSRNDKPR